jgi:hypothetical protein
MKRLLVLGEVERLRRVAPGEIGTKTWTAGVQGNVTGSLAINEEEDRTRKAADVNTSQVDDITTRKRNHGGSREKRTTNKARSMRKTAVNLSNKVKIIRNLMMEEISMEVHETWMLIVIETV